MGCDAHFFQGNNIALILMAILMSTLIYGLFRWDRQALLVNTSVAVFGMVFIGFGVGSLLLIRHMPGGIGFSILVFLLIWICDTFAYFIGISLGRHKLWPQVSPKKTIEGTVGGLLGAWVAACSAKFIFLPQLSLVDCLVLGTIAGVLGQAGDLVESAFKRTAQIKDSSRFLPGHGGFLDRFDSFFFTAPSIYYYIRFVLQ
jgi:phosphatidate cytidylyltransferase